MEGLRAIPLLLLVATLFACQTSALGRRQLKLLPESEMSAMGATAFTEISEQTPISSDARTNATVVCVANAVTGALTGPDARTRWEVRVFDDSSPNAFALPGGKIGVNTGLLGAARNQHQLAAVIGHEVSHVLAGHSNERMSAALTAQVALNAVSAIADPASPMHGQMMGLLGPAAGVPVDPPFPCHANSRSEAAHSQRHEPVRSGGGARAAPGLFIASR